MEAEVREPQNRYNEVIYQEKLVKEAPSWQDFIELRDEIEALRARHDQSLAQAGNEVRG